MVGVLSAVLTGLMAGLAALLGSLFHEVTHAAAVVATRQNLRGLNLHHLISTTRATVRYEHTENTAARYVIGLAPAIIGIAVAVVAYPRVVPLTGADGMALAIGWAFYTLQVSKEDITGRPPNSRREIKAMEGLFMTGVGLTLLAAVDFGPALFIGYVLFGAGFGLAAYNLAHEVRRQQATATEAGGD